jgi:Ca-activated chloride channel family protein
MKISSLASVILLAIAVPVGLAQTNTDDLPAAPSAVKHPQPQPQPQQTAPPEDQKPADPTTPATSATPGGTDKPQGGNASDGSILETAPDAGNNTDANSNGDDDAVPRFRLKVNEVNVVFTVTDRHGRLIKDLNRDDFKVIDDGRPDTRITDFQKETNLPLRVGLLVDASNSVRDRFKFEQDSAIEFLSQTVRPKYDQAFVVGFDATPEVTQDFTDNNEQLAKGVRMLRPGGGTAMFDAIYFACRDKLAKQPRTVATRRALIILSDGDDNQSHVTREEAIEMAQRAEVIVYTISTNITGSHNEGDKILKYISETTGGRAFFPFQITEVANAFAEIQDELRSQYALSYHPSGFSADGRYHTIQIMAQNHKNLKVRSRRGYYAPSR